MTNKNLLEEIRCQLDNAKKNEENLHFIFMGCFGKYGDEVQVSVANSGNMDVLTALIATAMEDSSKFTKVVLASVEEYVRRKEEAKNE